MKNVQINKRYVAMLPCRHFRCDYENVLDLDRDLVGYRPIFGTAYCVQRSMFHIFGVKNCVRCEKYETLY
jgi:hypothetical protein